ncbi:NAD(P)-dependent oxidoreductase [bacterium]|nr:NAD(P)-dependent oxidoreductase [bacterium]
MHIMLTGHKGYIGSHLLERLTKDHSVVGFDLQDGQDLYDVEFNEEFDLIIHLAGKSGVRQSMDDPAGYWRNNVEVTKRILNRYADDTRILYASSSSAYEPDLNPYAASKYVMEEAAERFPDTLGMRFHTVYDHNPRKGMFMQKLIDGELEYVTNHYRDFIHLDDLCDAIELLIKSRYSGTVDIGTGVPFKVRDFADNLPIRLNTPNERNWTCANMDRMKTLGFNPKRSIEKVLTNMPKDNIIKLEIGEIT